MYIDEIGFLRPSYILLYSRLLTWGANFHFSREAKQFLQKFLERMCTCVAYSMFLHGFASYTTDLLDEPHY